MAFKAEACVPGNSQLLQDPFVNHQQTQAVVNGPSLPDDVFVDNVFPFMTLRDLTRFKQTCTLFYQIMNENQDLNKLLNFPANLHLWASKQHLHLNREFCTPAELVGRWSCPRRDHTCFSLLTLLDIALWLRNAGSTCPIPPCALGVHQPRSLLPVNYVQGILGANNAQFLVGAPTEIFASLWRIHYCRWGTTSYSQSVLLVPHLCCQYGEAAFFDQRGCSSTDAEKAEAIERYVLDCFRRYFNQAFRLCRKEIE